MKRLSVLAAALLAFALGAQAQTFPTKPVNIIVPFPPGGGADALTRIMQPALGKAWGQSIIVENKPGAAGLIGADYVAKAAPDGHMLIMSSTGGITAKNVHEFAPVTLVSASPYVVVVASTAADPADTASANLIQYLARISPPVSEPV